MLKKANIQWSAKQLTKSIEKELLILTTQFSVDYVGMKNGNRY